MFNLLKPFGGMISHSAMFVKFKYDSFDIINISSEILEKRLASSNLNNKIKINDA